MQVAIFFASGYSDPVWSVSAIQQTDILMQMF